MTVRSVDVQTGEETSRALTQAEIDDANARTAAELDASAKDLKLAAVDAQYNLVCDGCTHLTFTWQADQLSVGSIIAKHHILEGTPPVETTWVDAGNAMRTLAWADFESLKDRLFSFHEDAFHNKNTHKNAITALGDTASVLAYDITTGWPT